MVQKDKNKKGNQSFGWLDDLKTKVHKIFDGPKIGSGTHD
jgi:hypothetical protein